MNAPDPDNCSARSGTGPGRLRRRTVLRAIGAGSVALAGASAVGSAAGQTGGMEVTLVDADPDSGFNYPYYLYAPETDATEPRPLLVEPNNTGGATDDFTAHREMARRLLTERWPRTLSDELEIPLLVPVFPRPESDPVDWTHYVHALDTETMGITEGDLARVDVQLRAMVEHARGELADEPYDLAERIVMDGFSASGNFVNRFTALHPEFVASVSAGGINGTAILPIEEDAGHTLNYQIGIANLEPLIGTPFDRDRYVEVNQLLYVGSEDDNDTIPHDDAWSADQRAVAREVYGEDVQDDRMPYCESVYEDVGADAEFRIYDGVGHAVTDGIVEDLIAFHRSNLEDAQVQHTRSDVSNGDSDGSTDGAGPGFGLAGALAGLGAAGLGAGLLARRRHDD